MIAGLTGERDGRGARGLPGATLGHGRIPGPVLHAGQLRHADEDVARGGAVVGRDRPCHRAVRRQVEAAVPDRGRLLAEDRVAPRGRPVPPLVDVAHEIRPADGHVPRVTAVPHDRLEAPRPVDEDHPSVGDISGHATLQN